MKFRNLLQFVFVLIAGQLMFSCNSVKYYEFAATNQAPYKVAKEKKAPEAVAPATVSEIALIAAAENVKEETNAPALEASTAPVKVADVKAPKSVTKAVAPEITATEEALTEVEVLNMAKERVKNMTKTEKKEFTKELKEAYRQDRGAVSIVEIILAILLPPLAVFLHDGLGTTFWISLLLTLLFFIPGVIYALLIVTDTI